MDADPVYVEAIQRTRDMARDRHAHGLVSPFGLNIVDLTWEDTGRFKGSAVGPNISDVTIQVAYRRQGGRNQEVACMPVIRYPNFSDLTCDVDPRDVALLVGNHHGGPLQRASLYEVLADPCSFLTRPESWKSARKSLLSDRDTRVLVSAQACFLPVPRDGIATFNPVLFNYQSVGGDPAVLTVLATREGSSITVIDNERDAFEDGAVWGQRLFHNDAGQRASLTGQRQSEFRAQQPEAAGQSGPAVGETGAGGLNALLLVQVPLRQKERHRAKMVYAAMACAPAMLACAAESDVEDAVLGHGDLEGPFTEIDNLAIERDDRYPVRVTVQLYKATSNGILSPDDVRAIKEQIDGVYRHGTAVGSLVVSGETGRVTEYHGAKEQPADWWEQFWRRYERHTGRSREEALARLSELLGRDVTRQPVTDLYLRRLLSEREGQS